MTILPWLLLAGAAGLGYYMYTQEQEKREGERYLLPQDELDLMAQTAYYDQTLTHGELMVMAQVLNANGRYEEAESVIEYADAGVQMGNIDPNPNPGRFAQIDVFDYVRMSNEPMRISGCTTCGSDPYYYY